MCSAGSRNRKNGIEPNQIEDYAVAKGHTKVTIRKHSASSFLCSDTIGVAWSVVLLGSVLIILAVHRRLKCMGTPPFSDQTCYLIEDTRSLFTSTEFHIRLIVWSVARRQSHNLLRNICLVYRL